MTEIFYKNWQEVPSEEWPWPNFTPFEMRCRGTGRLVVVSTFMDRLQRLRSELGKPLVVSSGYRDPEYNDEVSSTGLDGPHTTGRAVDLLVYSETAYHVVGLAYIEGFVGIGLHQKGAFRRRFIHLDDLKDFRPGIWTY